MIIPTILAAVASSLFPAGVAIEEPLSPPQPSVIVREVIVDTKSEVVESTISIQDKIAEKAKQYGVNVELAKEIARCESGFRQFSEDGSVLKGKINPQDIGIFQINVKYHLDESKKLGYDIYSVDGNIEYAMVLLSEQGGSKHWDWSSGCWAK